MKAHSDLIIRVVLAVAGLYLVINGAHGLAASWRRQGRRPCELPGQAKDE
ncbi:MAG TPA: hypothetical protein VEV61_12705 [Streptosporangiaceae bacterium]|nr:hypothetical protein [Streptosporangiaceae bacterium]